MAENKNVKNYHQQRKNCAREKTGNWEINRFLHYIRCM